MRKIIPIYYLLPSSCLSTYRCTSPVTSPGSAWRRVCSLEYSKVPFTLTSKRPPSEGTRVRASISGSNSFNNSTARLAARSV